MSDERLVDFPSKVSPVAADIIYVGDSASSYAEVKSTISSLTLTESQVTNLTSDLASKLNLSGGTMSGAINMGSHQINAVTDPSLAQDAATKNYVDTHSTLSPLTTKGDLYTYTTTNARLPVGTNTFILNADSTKTTGLNWIQNAATGVFASSTRSNYTPTGATVEGNLQGIDNALGAIGGNSVDFSAYQTPQQSIPHNVITQIEPWVANFDNGSYFNITTGTYTPLVTGTYTFTFQGGWAAPGSANATVTFYIYQNGVSVAQTVATLIPIGTFVAIAPLTVELEMNGTTDNVQVFCKQVQSSGSAALALGNVPTQFYFVGALINQKGVLNTLPSTLTNSQILLSQNSAPPIWSTATYPSTTSINSVLASSSANVLTSLTNFVMTTGQTIIGNGSGANVTGIGNSIFGHGSGATLTSGTNNTLIGDGNDVGASGSIERIAIGQGITVQNNHQCVIGSALTSMISGNPGVTKLGTLTSPFLSLILGNPAAPIQTVVGSIASTRTYTLQDNGSDGNYVVVPAAVTSNQLLYATSSTTYNGLATANSGVLVTSAGGVPSISTTLPAGLTIPGYQPTLTLPLSLSNGGTNAALTANNGGIFYSTASAGAILAGTATARQMLQSGASGAPAWSTTTYPATTTVNRILYSSATNTVSEISTANSAAIATNNSGVPSAFTNFMIDTSSQNTVMGAQAGSAGVLAATITNSTLYGYQAGHSLTAGSVDTTFIGRVAGQSATVASRSVGVGVFACASISGADNIGIGSNALLGGDVPSVTTGTDNIGIGSNAIQSFTTSSSNVGIGSSALNNLQTGSGSNVAIGYFSENNIAGVTTGTQNTSIGALTTANNIAAINRTTIGYNARGTKNNQVMLGNSSVTEIVSGSTTGGCYLGSTTNPFGFLFLGSASNYAAIDVGTQTTNGATIVFPDAGPGGNAVIYNTTSEVTGTTVSIVKSNTYIANNASQVVATLPTTAAEGDVFTILGRGAGGWKIAQNASQLIHYDGQVTTTGTGGSIASNGQFSNITVMCIITNTTWTVVSGVGNFTIT